MKRVAIDLVLFAGCSICGVLVAHFGILAVIMPTADPMGQFGLFMLLSGSLLAFFSAGLAVIVSKGVPDKTYLRVVASFIAAPALFVLLLRLIGANGHTLDFALLYCVPILVLWWIVELARKMKRVPF